MNTTTICPDEFSRQGEFVFLPECTVPTTVTTVLDGATIAILALMLFSMILVLVRFKSYGQKPIPNKILMCWTIIQLGLMSVRPSLSLAGFYSTNMWIGLLIHTTTALMASLPIFFMYIELKIIVRASLKTRTLSMQMVKNILLTIALFQGMLFILFPFLCFFLDISPHIGFWIPVIVVDFLAIPCFCYLGLSIFFKIKLLNNREYDKVSKKILVSVLGCSVLGIFTGTAGIIAIFFPIIDWIIVRLCWIAAAVFCQVIFFALVGKK